MSPRTNCCTAKLSWDFLLLQNGRCCIEFIFETQPDFWSWDTEEERGVPYFCLIKFRIMHVIWKLGEWKMPLFRILGLSGSGVQFSPVQSAWCLLGVHLRVVVFYTCFMRLFLSGFIFSGCCSCLLFILILQLNQKAFHRLAVAFRWNAFRLFNTRIKYLYLNFNAAIIYNLLRTHDCRIWVCCFGNRLFFKPSW